MDTDDLKLRGWLHANHPDVLVDVLEHMKDNPTYDMFDSCDAVDPNIYHYYSECLL